MLPSCKPPDAHGFVSLGISVDIAMSVLRYAKTIVAKVNPFMPRTLGDTFLHVDLIDRFVRVERPLVEYVHQPADAVAGRGEWASGHRSFRSNAHSSDEFPSGGRQPSSHRR
jgi:Acetyl-CoA hydrolase/transferase N-terminal domain